MENQCRAAVLKSVNDFISDLPRVERAKVLSDIEIMRNGDWSSLSIKTLKGPLRELIVKQNRIIFFINENVLYFIRAFQKKTTKTPPHEIEQAERIYKFLMR